MSTTDDSTMLTFDPDQPGHRFRLNGQPITDVVGVDPPARKFLILQHDLAGKRVPDTDTPWGFAVIEVQGEIEVEPIAPPQTTLDYPNAMDGTNWTMPCLQTAR